MNYRKRCTMYFTKNCLLLLLLTQTFTNGVCLRFLVEQICHVTLAVVHQRRIVLLAVSRFRFVNGRAHSFRRQYHRPFGVVSKCAFRDKRNGTLGCPNAPRTIFIILVRIKSPPHRQGSWKQRSERPLPVSLPSGSAAVSSLFAPYCIYETCTRGRHRSPCAGSRCMADTKSNKKQ